jgi:hypothetical protein
MSKFKYIMVRAAVIDEYYEIEADSESEAVEIVMDGDYGDPIKTEFVDWRDDEWQVADTEPIDPLYRMVKDYASKPEYFINESGLKIDAITGEMYSKEIG